MSRFDQHVVYVWKLAGDNNLGCINWYYLLTLLLVSFSYVYLIHDMFSQSICLHTYMYYYERSKVLNNNRQLATEWNILQYLRYTSSKRHIIMYFFYVFFI